MDAKEIFRALQQGTISSADAERELLRVLKKEPEKSPTLPEKLLDAATAKDDMLANVNTDQKESEESSTSPEKLLDAVGDGRIGDMLANMSTDQVVKMVEIEPGIVQVTMCDRSHKNTFSLELIVGLIRAFQTIRATPAYKVVVLTGYDRYFACGGSQEGMLAIQEGKVKMTDVNLYSLPLECEIPVIAAMQGHGIGGGWCFGLFSDFVVMSLEGIYTCNHMRYGFTPGDGATLILPEKLGYNLAQEILFTGKNYRGSELRERGAPVPIVAGKEALPYALNLARELAAVPRQSLVLLKAHMTEMLRERLKRVLEKEWAMQEKTLVNKPDVVQKLLSAFDQPAPKEVQSETQATQKKAIQTRTSTSELLLLNRQTQGKPVFWFHGEGGGVEGYHAIATHCTRPFYGIQARGRMSEDTPMQGCAAMATYYIDLLRAVQPEGPYDLGGYSLGGALAYEVARQLQAMGHAVRTIVMVDTLDQDSMQRQVLSERAMMLQAINLSLMNRIRQKPEILLQKLIHHQEIPVGVTGDDLLRQLVVLGRTRGLSITRTEEELCRIFEKTLQVQRAFHIDQFVIEPLPDPQAVICYYFRNRNGDFYGKLQPYMTDGIQPVADPTEYWRGWQQYLPHFHLKDIDATNHITLLFEPSVEKTIAACIEEIYHEEAIAR